MSTRAKRDHALVVGGGMAGICAARVLTELYEKVTIVERDVWPEGVDARPGTPQARHPHALLSRGRVELDRLFPGFVARMLAAGALPLEDADIARFMRTGWHRLKRTGVQELFASRPLIEWVARQLLREQTNVEVLEQTSVEALLVHPGETPTARGVRVTSRAGGKPTEIEADLVIDASGRYSKAPRWLDAIGLEPPREELVDSKMTYTTQWFRAPPPSKWPREWWWKASWIVPAPPETLDGAVLFPIEDNKWIVTLGRFSGERPPADHAGLLDALRQLRSPLIWEAARIAEPISAIHGHASTANRFRRYDEWAARLPGFLAFADSLVAFNPIGGRGMTTASMQAAKLHELLRAGTSPRDPEFAPRFYREAAVLVRDAWQQAVAFDRTFPRTIDSPPRVAGRRSLATRVKGGVTRQYSRLVLEAAEVDATVASCLLDVMHFVRPQSTLTSPSVVGRVLTRALARRTRHSRAERLSPMPPKSWR